MLNDALSLSLSLCLCGACHEDVAASTSRLHTGLSIARRLTVRRQAKVERAQIILIPQPFSARFASVFQFFVASLWQDPECRPGALGSGLDRRRHGTDDQRRTSAVDG